MSSIKIVLPDGSMQETITRLLAKAGLEVMIKNKRTMEGKNNVPWIEQVAFQRPQEIPNYLKNGNFDAGFAGEDWLTNWECDLPILLKLPIGRSGNRAVKIVLAVKADSGFNDIRDLPKDCQVATEYVELTRRFLRREKREDIGVIPSYGNTEQKIRFGASAIVDVVESGESLRENGLVIISELMESNTVLAVNPKSYANDEKRSDLKCLAKLLKGAYQASRYIMLTANVPEKSLRKASRIIGGLKGPSQLPLTVKGWTALQSVVLREYEQEIIFELLQIGVTDIVVNRDIPLIMT